MNGLFSACVPDAEGAVLSYGREHILALWIRKVHVVNLVSVGFEVSLLFQLSIANCVESDNTVSTTSDEVRSSTVPANRVYCVWTSTVGAWLVIVLAWSPVVRHAPRLHLWLYLKVYLTHCSEPVACIILKRIHLHHLIIIVPSSSLGRRNRRPASAFHFRWS